jgi:XTP/dITP diphosphohydrolase
MKIVLASSNAGKLAEFDAIFEGTEFEILPQSVFSIPDAEETGKKFEENALIKARHASLLSGMPAIADDSGLEVDALGGRPGIHSARYAGEQASDAKNIEKLLGELKGIPMENRQARFQCVIAMVRRHDDPDPVVCKGSWEGLPVVCKGRWEGLIAEKPAGENGFGYDPVFCPESFGCTTAQLSTETKNSYSHRARALKQFKAVLF